MDSPSPKTVVKRLWNPAGVEQSKTRKTRSICEKTDPTIFFFWVLRLSQSTSSGRGAKVTLRQQGGVRQVVTPLDISAFT